MSSDQLDKDAAGWVWWSDRALRRNSGSGVSPTGPVSRRAATPPSHRADEPPSARAPGKRGPPRPHRAQGPFQARPANAVSRHRRVLSFASSRRPPTHNAWPFAVARATQVCRRNRHQPESSRRAIAFARSDDPTAADESAPSATPPPTSLNAIVRCGDTPFLQPPGDRRERHKREPHLGPMSASQPKHSIRSEL